MTTVVALKNGTEVDRILLNTVYKEIKDLKKNHERALLHLIQKCTDSFDKTNRLELQNYLLVSKPELIRRNLLQVPDSLFIKISNIVISSILPVYVTSDDETTEHLVIINPAKSNTWEWLIDS